MKKEGKPRYDLIPNPGLREMAKALTSGIAKHGERDYLTENCADHEFLAAIGRHWGAVLDGEGIDEDSGAHHLGCIMANAAMLLHRLEMRGRDREEVRAE